MRKLVLLVVGLLIAMLGLVGVTASPASAGQCNGIGPFKVCGDIRHYSPDNGYNPPILFRCDYGTGPTRELYIGHSSTEFCKDTDEVYVRYGEVVVCKLVSGWKTVLSGAGWHKINDVFNDGEGCVLQLA